MPELAGIISTATSGLASGLGAGGLFWWLIKRSERRSQEAHDGASTALGRIAGMERVCRTVREARDASDRLVLSKLDHMDGKLDGVAERVARMEGRLNGGERG
jgi:hypothetical protein